MNKEKIKIFFTNKENKVYTIIMIMLIIIISLQVKILCSFSSPYKMRNFKEIEKLKKVNFEKQRKAFESFDREIEEMKKNREKMLQEINKVSSEEQKKFHIDENNKENINKKTKREFIFRPKFEEKDDSYVLILKTPREITIENIKVELKNKNLTIKVEKEEKIESYFSFKTFAKTIYLEKASEQVDNLKVSFDKNELNVVVKKNK